MSMLSKLNSPVMYLICGGIVAFVAFICIVFLVRAWRAGLAIGMDRVKMKRVIVSSATFSALPSVVRALLNLPTPPCMPPALFIITYHSAIATIIMMRYGRKLAHHGTSKPLS